MSGPVQPWAAATRDPAFVQRVLAVRAHFDAALRDAAAGRAPDGQALAALDRAIASLNALATGSIAQARAADPPEAACLQAKAALAQSVAAELAAAANPAAAVADWIAARLELAAIDPEADAREAREAAAELAADLLAAGPEARQEAFAARWSIPGLLAVLEEAPGERRLGLAADIVLGAGEDRAWLVDLCLASVQDCVTAASEPGSILDEEGVASTLTGVMGATGPSAAYADGLAAAAGGGEVTSRLLDRAAPAELTRLVAALHDAAAIRFGGWVGMAVARGHTLLRVLAPALADDQAAALQAACDDPGCAARPAVDAYVADLVRAGHLAEQLAKEGEDGDDLAAQRGLALQDATTLAASFAEPCAADPLGTMPATRVTALGQAILRARAARPDGIDWAAVERLRAEQPGAYLALIEQERCAVLDLIEA